MNPNPQLKLVHGGNGGVDGTSGGRPPYEPSMDLIQYRIEQNERQTDAVIQKIGRIDESLNEIKHLLSAVSTKSTIHGWGIGLVAVVVATVLALGALLIQSSGNQLSAFQAGLSAVEAGVAASPPRAK